MVNVSVKLGVLFAILTFFRRRIITMYKGLISLVSVVLVLSLVGYVSAADAESSKTEDAPAPADAEILSTEATIVIDGVKEDVWLVSVEYELKNTTADESPKSDTDCSAIWYALWDSDYLYVFVDVNDEDLQNDSGRSYEDDSIEIYVDAGNDKQKSYGKDDYQYRIAWNTKAPEIEEHHHSDRSLTGVEFILLTKGVDVEAGGRGNGYTLEIKFPWSSFLKDAKVSPGYKLGFDVHINDDDGGRGRDTQLGWHATTGKAWSNPSLLGTVVLVTSRKPGI